MEKKIKKKNEEELKKTERDYRLVMNQELFDDYSDFG